MPAKNESGSPTKDELKLFKHLGLEWNQLRRVFVLMGDPPCNEINICDENDLIKTVCIPFRKPEWLVDVPEGALLWDSYPNANIPRSDWASALSLLLCDIAAHSRAEKLLARKAEEENALRIRSDFGEFDRLDERSDC